MKTPVRDDYKNTCLTDCVALWFGVNPKRVPFFIKYDDNWKHLKDFFRRRGYKFHWEKFSYAKAAKQKFSIVIGVSPRSRTTRIDHSYVRQHHVGCHAIILKRTKREYDPSPSQKWIRGKPLWIGIVERC